MERGAKLDKRVVLGVLFFVLASSMSLPMLDAAVEQVKGTPDPWGMPVIYIQPILLGPSTLRVNVAIYNLTNAFYSTDEEWFPGQPLGAYAEPSRHNYSLGNLWAFDVSVGWNPIVLEYLDHVKTVPGGATPQPFRSKGILDGPLFPVRDEVDPVAGTYRLAYSSLYPASPFNAPGDAANLFSMTFAILSPGDYGLSLDSVDLAVAKVQFPDVDAQIPYRVVLDPYVPHNIGIEAAPRNKDIIGQGMSFNAYALVKNAGDYSETSNVTIFASDYSGDYPVGNALAVVSPRSVKSIDILCSTAGLPKGHYILKAAVETVTGEAYAADNDVLQGTIFISLVGDVDGDRGVNIFDLVIMAQSYGECLPSLRYNPYTDIDNDGCSDIIDIVRVATHYGRIW